MWLYLIGIVILIAGVVGSIATGGIFTLILIPVGIVVVASAAGYSMMGRINATRQGGTHGHPSQGQPLPHSLHGDPAHVTTSPEALTEARRTEQ